MEFVEGRNLYQLLRSERQPPLRVLEILRQITCGLSAAHLRNVVHSDIKPANILLTIAKASEAEAADATASSAGIELDSQSILEFDADPSGTLDESPQDEGLLTEIRRRIGEPSTSMPVDPPYFHRRSESRFLEYYLQRMRDGRGYFLVVEGEEGIGKDRLISHFLEQIDSGIDPTGCEGARTRRLSHRGLAAFL